MRKYSPPRPVKTTLATWRGRGDVCGSARARSSSSEDSSKRAAPHFQHASNTGSRLSPHFEQDRSLAEYSSDPSRVPRPGTSPHRPGGSTTEASSAESCSTLSEPCATGVGSPRRVISSCSSAHAVPVYSDEPC